jgi:fructan beta-fructosidase
MIIFMPIFEKYRPSMHFSPAFGWINDPNGLVYSDGNWHLFYQYFPMGITWGPMHWGHAISRDLVNWKHCPIAIAPDKLGHMFSGSAIVDKNNTSGLFDQESDDNLIIYYTASMPRHEICPDDLQTQCLAYSKDAGLTWNKYEKNPILPNPDLVCYRDPKILWVERSKHWVMVLTQGQSIGIYKSTNLLNWEYCSEFGAIDGYHSRGPWECPDLFPLTTEDGLTKWVMIVGVGPHDTDMDYGQTPCTQYFIGEFDGETFINDNSSNKVLWLDQGCDYYATQSYFNAPSDRRIGISWMSNWRYSRDTETKTFRGIMTLPREYHLVKNSKGELVVSQGFGIDVYAHFNNELSISDEQLITPNSGVYHITADLSLSIEEKATIALFGQNESVIEIERNSEGLQVSSFRRYDGDNDLMCKEFPHRYSVFHPCIGDIFSVEIIADNGAVEFLLDNGKFSLTQLHYPLQPDGTISLCGHGWLDVVVRTQNNDIK